MRGFLLGAPDRRIRIDFADNGTTPSFSKSSGGFEEGGMACYRMQELPEVARKSTTVWQRALILKSSLFPAKLHLTDGDNEIVDSLMKDEEGKHHLRITQRLRLDQPKLEDVQKRISTSSVASSDDASVQTRPLRNLVSYLEQKEAAGVISLTQ
ncbi:RNA-binding protein spenito-like [Armigeres subalbatus]|uniref:RNA-binding protein spenito-like n=1 Tax=Armigeres subalbatus TaxID=124917 RepID=UPI002ED6253C